MNRRLKTKGVPAVPHRKQRRKRGIVPTGGQAPLSAKELKRHARLLAEGKPMSGRCGAFVYYMRNGKQCWHRYCVPKDPRTLAQQRSRARFGAASKTWSEDGLLTEAHRDEWYADGARKRSRPRLGSSGPLTGQQHYIGRNSTRNQRDSEMLLHPHQRKQEKAKSKGLRPELTAQVHKFQHVTRPTSGTRRAHAVAARSIRRVLGGYATKPKTRQLISQVPRLQMFTRPTSGRRRTHTRAVPVQRQWKTRVASRHSRLGLLKHSPRLRKGRRNVHQLKLRRGG